MKIGESWRHRSYGSKDPVGTYQPYKRVKITGTKKSYLGTEVCFIVLENDGVHKTGSIRIQNFKSFWVKEES